MDCSPPGSSVHGDSSRQEYWSELPCPPPGDLPSPGMEPRSPTWQADSLLSEPPGKPKNTGVGSLSLLQGSSRLRNWTGVSYTASGFFISWATREALPWQNTIPYTEGLNSCEKINFITVLELKARWECQYGRVLLTVLAERKHALVSLPLLQGVILSGQDHALTTSFNFT